MPTIEGSLGTPLQNAGVPGAGADEVQTLPAQVGEQIVHALPLDLAGGEPGHLIPRSFLLGLFQARFQRGPAAGGIPGFQPQRHLILIRRAVDL